MREWVAEAYYVYLFYSFNNRLNKIANKGAVKIGDDVSIKVSKKQVEEFRVKTRRYLLTGIWQASPPQIFWKCVSAKHQWRFATYDKVLNEKEKIELQERWEDDRLGRVKYWKEHGGDKRYWMVAWNADSGLPENSCYIEISRFGGGKKQEPFYFHPASRTFLKSLPTANQERETDDDSIIMLKDNGEQLWQWEADVLGGFWGYNDWFVPPMPTFIQTSNALSKQSRDDLDYFIGHFNRKKKRGNDWGIHYYEKSVCQKICN